MRRALLLAVFASAALLPHGSARAADEPAGYGRVVVAEAEVRSGPGMSYRVIYRADRGETLLLSSRSKTGFWLEVMLPDGREGYVLGDVIEPMAFDDEAEVPFRLGLFAPPVMKDALGGFTVSGGIFDRDGYLELRPALRLAPTLALEPYLGIALEEERRRIVYGGMAALTLAPDWVLAPFVALGAGGVHEDPSDEFVQDDHAWFHARASAGVHVSLRWRILVKIEAAHLVLFNEDEYDAVQSYMGGIGTYF